MSEAMNQVREPACAGRFYPAQTQALRDMVQSFLREGVAAPARAVIAPHAGYVYSGRTAGMTLSEVEWTQTVLIMCPKHTRLGEHTSLLTAGIWAWPGAQMEIDQPLATHLLARLPGVVSDPAAHRQEHAIEVLLPFLHALKPNMRFVPLAMGYRDVDSCREFGEALAKALDEWPEPVVMLVSSDMNHFEDQQTTLHKDQAALEHLLALDAFGLHEICRRDDISMCGVVPATVMLYALHRDDGPRAMLVHHCTSGDVSGDLSSVVGYAGVVIR